MDDDLYLQILELEQKIYEAIADPNGICNEPEGHCFKCSLVDRCNIKYKKLKEET